jgi:hypothetical protein
MSAREAVRRAQYGFCDDVEGDLSTTKPAGLAAEPEAASGYPLYGVLRLGGTSPVLLRLDESQGTRAGYDRLIIDWNANGDLRDDAVSSRINTPDRTYRNAELLFGPLEPPPSAGRDSRRARYFAYGGIGASRSIVKGEDVGGLELVPGTWLEATVTVNGVQEKIGILDGNCNVRLGDTTQVSVRTKREGLSWHLNWGDVLLRDRNGSGRFEPDTLCTEADPFSRIVYFGSKPYTLTLAADRSSITIVPCTGKIGRLAAPAKSRVDRLMLCRWRPSGGTELIMPTLVKGVCEAPPGKYGLISCVVTSGERDGATVLAEAFLDRPGNAVLIEADQTSRLRCGAPLQLRVEARSVEGRSVNLLDALGNDALSQISSIEIGVDVIGAGGEHYGGFLKTTKHGTTRPRPAQFTVSDEKGTVLGTGRMKYG